MIDNTFQKCSLIGLFGNTSYETRQICGWNTRFDPDTKKCEVNLHLSATSDKETLLHNPTPEHLYKRCGFLGVFKQEYEIDSVCGDNTLFETSTRKCIMSLPSAQTLSIPALSIPTPSTQTLSTPTPSTQTLSTPTPSTQTPSTPSAPTQTLSAPTQTLSTPSAPTQTLTTPTPSTQTPSTPSAPHKLPLVSDGDNQSTKEGCSIASKRHFDITKKSRHDECCPELNGKYWNKTGCKMYINSHELSHSDFGDASLEHIWQGEEFKGTAKECGDQCNALDSCVGFARGGGSDSDVLVCTFQREHEWSSRMTTGLKSDSVYIKHGAIKKSQSRYDEECLCYDHTGNKVFTSNGKRIIQQHSN